MNYYCFYKDAIESRTQYDAEEVGLYGFRMPRVAGICCKGPGQAYTCIDNDNLIKSMEV